MVSAKKFLVIAVMLGMPFFLAAPAMADWDEGDGHKMHFPQLPDPTGWDVDWTESWLGDDWQCSQTGPVADIHLWVSFKEWSETVVPASMSSAPVSVQIWSNDPGGAGSPYSYSTPKDMLWEYTFDPSGYSIRYPAAETRDGIFPPRNSRCPKTMIRTSRSTSTRYQTRLFRPKAKSTGS